MQHILLYGNSIFLGGLAAQLQGQADIAVTQQAPGAGPLNLGALDVVIVDFNDISPADVLAILCARPDLRIVGINPAGGVITVLTGQVYLARTLTDVMACLT